MKAAVAKKEIELALADRFGSVFQRREKPPVEIVPSGIGEIDARLNGFPRGAITEIHGTASSGRTSLLLAALAAATMQEETCALVDTSDTFDLSSAISARVNCDRLLWVRCSNSIERAFKATDLLLQSGGFGLVVLNLADVTPKSARRIITSWWFRFRRAVENTPTVLMVLTPVTCTRSCAMLVLEVKNEGPVWPSTRSIILENDDQRLAGEHSQSQLSLVANQASAPGPRLSPEDRNEQRNCVSAAPNPFLKTEYSSRFLTHSHLLQEFRIRVNQERPVVWSPDPLRFKTRLH